MLQRVSVYSGSCYKTQLWSIKLAEGVSTDFSGSDELINLMCCCSLLLDPLADGSVGQLLLLAHHRGSGDPSEASEFWDKDDRGRVWWAGWRAFR